MSDLTDAEKKLSSELRSDWTMDALVEIAWQLVAYAKEFDSGMSFAEAMAISASVHQAQAVESLARRARGEDS